MNIVVELFGIPCRRAGISHVEVELDAEDATLQMLIDSLAERFPPLAEECFRERRLHPGYALNLDGERFIRDLETRLRDGQHVLLMSADAGG